MVPFHRGRRMVMKLSSFRTFHSVNPSFPLSLINPNCGENIPNQLLLSLKTKLISSRGFHQQLGHAPHGRIDALGGLSEVL